MQEASIGIAEAAASITINAEPAFAITPNASATNSSVFVPSPSNEALIDVLDSTYIPQAQAGTQSAAIGGIVYQQSVNVTVGANTNSLVPQLLNAYQYVFENITLPSSVNATIEYGDLVFFLHDGTGLNDYGAGVMKASVTNTSLGAFSNLFIFQSYTNNTLKVMHKGYIEIPDNKINSWSVGSTLYLNSDSKLNTSPTTSSGHWVRSLGFCIPNNENKKIIWFEPDSTYLKLI